MFSFFRFFYSLFRWFFFANIFLLFVCTSVSASTKLCLFVCVTVCFHVFVVVAVIVGVYPLLLFFVLSLNCVWPTLLYFSLAGCRRRRVFKCLLQLKMSSGQINFKSRILFKYVHKFNSYLQSSGEFLNFISDEFTMKLYVL